jgi:hypothetical protein
MNAGTMTWQRGDPPILDQDVIPDLEPALPGEPNAWDILSRMYDSELSGGLSSDWDGGFKVWLGGDWNDHIVEAWFKKDEFGKIGPWLDYETRRFFPESPYASGPSPYAQGKLFRATPAAPGASTLRIG